MNAILNRRSVRKYTDKKVTQEELNSILRAGMAGPSSENNQEWEFVVITSEDTKQKIVDINPYAKCLSTAPLAILVCADMSKISEPDSIYWIQDLSACSQNMLIQARELGLSSLWMGLDDNQIEQIKGFVNAPANVRPLMLLAFGTAECEKPAIDRFLEDRIHIEKF